jgi:hypothetical protein
MSSWLFTFLLLFILTLLIIINIFVFISGPARKIDADDEKLFRSVVTAYQLTDAVFLNRHVHERITYVASVGSNREKLIFYDEDGWVFLLIDTPLKPQALLEYIANGTIDESDLSYGYYQTPVFVIDNDERLQYINIVGETVFFLKKGD